MIRHTSVRVDEILGYVLTLVLELILFRILN
jgi:hypothetical protein